MAFARSDSTLIGPELTEPVIGAFYDTYNDLGAGFPEFVFRRAMAIAIGEAGLQVVEEVELPVWFRGHRIVRFKADLLVADRLIVEVKISPVIDPFHKAQVLHYLKATDLEIGLLLNFGRKPEFERVVYANRRKQSRTDSPSGQQLPSGIFILPRKSGSASRFARHGSEDLRVRETSGLHLSLTYGEVSRSVVAGP